MESSHLLTSEKFIKTQNTSKSKFLERKFIESCLNLNTSLIEPYINANEIFENKEKYLFLSELNKLFQPYTPLISALSVRMENKTCLGCSRGKRVLKFVIYSRDNSQEVIDFGFVIDAENGILKDIYRCWQYEQSSSCSIIPEGIKIKPEGLPAITILNYTCK